MKPDQPKSTVAVQPTKITRGTITLPVSRVTMTVTVEKKP